MLEVRGLKKHYPLKLNFTETSWVRALDGVDFKLAANQTLGLVGESGCGKSTLAKILTGLEKPNHGEVLWEGEDYFKLSRRERLGKIQMVFQDPYGSLNPRKKVWEIIAEPLVISSGQSSAKLKTQALEMMELVCLNREFADRYPHMFSGGQRQRIGIARGLITRPKILILDEPVSALDVSVQAQVLNLLIELQAELKLSYLFISHDLNVVKHISDQLMVMYLGKVIERGDTQVVYSQPRHPYTLALMGKALALGELPSPINPPRGCHFHPRCSFVQDKCRENDPSQIQNVSCFFPVQ